jgi:hypothetical protein
VQREEGDDAMNEDLQYLKLLSIFHYVVGGLAALFACFPIIYIAVGVLAVYAPGTMDSEGDALPALFGWIFIVVGAGLILIGWAFAVFTILAGRYLTRQVHYLFCMVMAAIECIFMPFGTVLGVFTIIVLAKPSVKKMFA